MNGAAGTAPAAPGGGGGGGTISRAADLPPLEASVGAVITAEDAVRLRAVPIREEGAGILVAMVDAGDFAASDEISILAARPVTPLAVTPELFQHLLRSAFGATV